MKILTLENRTYTLEKIPEWVDEKLRFAVLDNANPEEPDFFYIPLIFLEKHSMVLRQYLEIGPHMENKDAIGLENINRRTRTTRNARITNYKFK